MNILGECYLKLGDVVLKSMENRELEIALTTNRENVESHVMIRSEPICWDDEQVRIQVLWKKLNATKTTLIFAKEYPPLVIKLYKKNENTNKNWLFVASAH